MPFNIEFDSPAPMEASFQLGQGGGGAVSSVNGQIGDVVLDAGNIAYSDSTTYPSGSVGAEVSDLKSALGYVTPEMFGAKGDGETDDTIALNSALAANACVKLTGNYYINGEIRLANNQKIEGIDAALYQPKSRITLGSNGVFTLASADCSFKNIYFHAENATLDPSTFLSKAIDSSISGAYDIDATIDNCVFTGFATPITINGRGVYLRRTLFTGYTTALTLNYVASGNDYIKKYGGRAFIVENCRFHSNSGGSRDVNILLVQSGSSAYGLVFNNNYCDQNAGRINIAGDVFDSSISNNKWIFPCAMDGVSVYSAAGSHISGLIISGNTFTSASRYAQDGNASDRYIVFDGVCKNVVVSNNTFSYAMFEAICFSEASEVSVIANTFEAMSLSDAEDGKAVNFIGIASGVVISDNNYMDTFGFGKTNLRSFFAFAFPKNCRNVKIENNVAVTGNMFLPTNVTLATASMAVDGATVKITQSGNYGTATFRFTGLTPNKPHTVSFNLIEKNSAYNVYYIIGSGSAWTQASGTGAIVGSAESDANGELTIRLRPSSQGGVTASATIELLHIAEGSLPTNGQIDMTNMELYPENACIVAAEETARELEIRTVGITIYKAHNTTSGKSFDTNGAIVNVGAAFITDFIKIAPGFEYELSQSLSSSSYANVFYDSDFNVVGTALSTGTAPITVTAPATAKFLRATGINANVNDFTIKVKGVPAYPSASGVSF